MSSPVTLRGRLTAVPELRYTNGGKALAQFTVVTAKRFKDAGGEWQEKDVSFWDCTAFDVLAEQIIEKCDKGTLMIVVGSMYQEKWKNKDNENRTSWKVLVDDAAPSLKVGQKVASSSSSSSPKPSSYDEPPPF